MNQFFKGFFSIFLKFPREWKKQGKGDASLTRPLPQKSWKILPDHVVEQKHEEKGEELRDEKEFWKKGERFFSFFSDNVLSAVCLCGLQRASLGEREKEKTGEKETKKSIYK